MTDDYQLLPSKVIEDLRDDVESLRKKLMEPDNKSQELLLEIEALKDDIQDLHTIFQRALEQTTARDDPHVTLSTIKERLDAVVQQNETIAKGMIAISDKVDEWMQGQRRPMQVAPMVSMDNDAPPPMTPRDFPPPPPEMGKKKLISNLFNK